MTPSPTRGAIAESAPRAGYGNEPSAIIPAKRSKIDTYVRSSSPGGRLERCTHSRVNTAIGRPSQRTGTASMRAESGNSSTRTSPSVISPDVNADASTDCSLTLANEPTQSVWYTVWPVAGRTWPTISHRSSFVGTYSSRSAKQKSASIPHSDIRRLRCDTWSRSRVVLSRTSAARKAIGGSLPDLLSRAGGRPRWPARRGR